MARSASRKKAKSKRRRPAAVKRRGNGLPGWVWLVAGIAIAIFVGVILSLAKPDHKLKSSLTPSTPVQHKPDTGPVPVPPAKPPRFSFYHLLPGRKLAPRHAGSQALTQEQEPSSQPLSSPALKPQPPSEPKPAPQPSIQTASPTSPAEPWLVQLGSYRSEQQANQARAKADLLGVVAHLRAAMVDGHLWYRVRIGPVAGEDKAVALRDNLRASGFKAFAFKQKD